MNKSRTVCKECIAYHYWHHMDDRKRFFKVLMGDFKNGVTIPRKSVANIREHLSEEVKLEAPDGKTYTVQVAMEQNELVLRSGWSDFACAYELKLGDLLVFRNSEKSHFKVRIFGPSGCEKELSCVLMDGAPCVQERKVSHDNHTQSSTGKRMAIGNPSGSRKTLKTNPTDSPSQKNEEHVPSSEGIQKPMNSGGSVQKPTKSCIVLPTGCNMTSEQRAQVITLEQKTQPELPFYITAMHRRSVASGILAISKNYAMKHLANKSGIIQLSQLDGSKIWAINLDITTKGHYAVSTGWMDFIRDNKLREGDICIFQPSKSKNGVTLIFHPLEESHCLQPPGYVPSSRSPAHGVTEPGYIVPRKTILTDQQKHQVEEKVRAIRSPYHLFVLIVQTSNITERSCIMGS
ncbi:hypothetical protein PAHAL_3G480700 [Panicum hallii]|uniref:TF-B3 domain-containing protein n=2 Tax=Panicum hallii TaxID=206008 RepID=A0A2S3HFG2_9POAL|nr:B3 domain-containing protein LOC_Os12g40080-like isoform X1 [Panicum hallii]XP_025808339.1 B3 domain-containing protein LOC_Os12g40080-like isoform X1 [Panicum hallii]PAN21622.2 hypothetical protein PAHAL_3G480700 [Panicum hallii]